ncbi:unnamed protein product [Clavelina lepadiformis]|uniref:C-Jun-amino-terminal kinase-interacting protein 4 n=1 Tax=Clavelina lepadiformis TaxID=159417 RepID=A0ABP0H3Q7_CLALP
MDVIYGSEQELNSGLSSEKIPSPEIPMQVQAMANNVYSEFQRMMALYGEDVIKELMPLIVTILEALDHALTDCNESAVEIEMLKDDNEQLVTQYDRERQLRRTSEQRLLEYEDQHEVANREIRSRADGLETAARHLELKCKNYSDQVERLQEREAEFKREYSVLHDRHTEMIQSYMEHIEKTKTLQQQVSFNELSQSPVVNFVDWYRKDLTPGGSTISPAESTEFQGFTPDQNQNIVQSPVVSQPGFTSTPGGERSHVSLQDELPKSVANIPTSPAASDVRPKLPSELPLEIMDLGSPSVESEGAEWVMSSAVEDYRNETPELEKRAPNANTEDVDSPVESRVYEKNQVTNESSLYAELSQQDIGDVDEGADILGMSKEVENLILENTKLLATKNALNVVKDDLIQQVDQLSTQHTLLREELKCSENAKTNLTEKVKELESQLSKLQHDLKKTAIGATTNTTSKQIEEEDVLPLSQRKRFTRVEMARVLMERNQYKERLMELQEAVRWTETLRASRNHPDVNQNKNKNKSTIFHFFSRLFTSGNNNESSSQTSEMQGRNMRRSMGSDMSISMAYNAPSSKVIPRSHSSTISMYGRSPTIDALREDSPSKRDGTRREVQSKINDNSRLQACGWSLPNSPASPKEGSRTVPVPVYCAPLLDNNNNMKLWCATAVNISDGRTKDGGAVVGTGSVFYDNSENIENNEDSNRKSPGSLEKLDEEIETQKQYFKTDSKHNMLSSYVWLVSGDSKSGTTSKGSMVTIVDASEPNRCIDKFSVGVYDTHILCITSVPGPSKDDYIRAEDSDITSKAGTTGFTAGPSSTNLTTSCDQELATEATEETVSTSTAKSKKRGVTEHVFTDPNSIHPTSSTNVVDGSSDDPEIGKVEKVQSPVITPDQMTADLASGDSKVDCPLDATRLASLQPTMWLGAQSGYVYVHSAISNWKKCLHQIRLKDSVLAIVHLKGRTLAALADGTVAIFRRNTDGVWNLSNYHLLDLGRPHHSIRCMSVVYNHVWCAYRNKIHIVEPQSIRIFKSFDAHPRRESQVRQLAWAGDGVWVSIRLDSTVRLYHARTLQHLQDVDVEPYVSKVLGSGKLGFSFVRITSLMISNYRLWIGTGNGVVMSVPLSEGAKTSTSSPILSSSPRNQSGEVIRVYSDPVTEKVTPGTFIPYCSMANAQLSFHGYRDAVKFFVAIPGCVTTSSSGNTTNLSPPKQQPALNNDGVLVISGGEGYVDFRKGDLGAISPEEKHSVHSQRLQSALQNSHIIIWQLTHS